MAGEQAINGTATLLSAATTTATGTTFATSAALNGAASKTGFFQVNIASGTATVLLEGKTHDDADFATLATLSSDGAMQVVDLPPLVRARVSAISGATVHAYLNC